MFSLGIRGASVRDDPWILVISHQKFVSDAIAQEELSGIANKPHEKFVLPVNGSAPLNSIADDLVTAVCEAVAGKASDSETYRNIEINERRMTQPVRFDLPVKERKMRPHYIHWRPVHSSLACCCLDTSSNVNRINLTNRKWTKSKAK